MAYPAFNVSSLFVIIPGNDQEVRWSALRPVVMPENAQCFFERFAATVGHMPIAGPRSPAIVESGPDCAHRDFVRMTREHVLVEILQIIFPIVAAVASPSVLAGLHPGVKSVECVRVLGALIFVDQQGRIRPRLRDLAYAIPIRRRIFGKDEDNRPSVVAQE